MSDHHIFHTSQTAPVLEFRILWTSQKHQKTKAWHDGFLRLHTFNKRILIYDDHRTLVTDKYHKTDRVEEGDELDFEHHLVTVEEFLKKDVQDLTPVFSPAIMRKQKKIAAAAAAVGSSIKPVVQTPIRGRAMVAETPQWQKALPGPQESPIRPQIVRRQNATPQQPPPVRSIPQSRPPQKSPPHQNRHPPPPKQRTTTSMPPISKPPKSRTTETSLNLSQELAFLEAVLDDDDDDWKKNPKPKPVHPPNPTHPHPPPRNPPSTSASTITTRIPAPPSNPRSPHNSPHPPSPSTNRPPTRPLTTTPARYSTRLPSHHRPPPSAPFFRYDLPESPPKPETPPRPYSSPRRVTPRPSPTRPGVVSTSTTGGRGNQQAQQPQQYQQQPRPQPQPQPQQRIPQQQQPIPRPMPRPIPLPPQSPQQQPQPPLPTSETRKRLQLPCTSTARKRAKLISRSSAPCPDEDVSSSDSEVPMMISRKAVKPNPPVIRKPHIVEEKAEETITSTPPALPGKKGWVNTLPAHLEDDDAADDDEGGNAGPESWIKGLKRNGGFVSARRVGIDDVGGR